MITNALMLNVFMYSTFGLLAVLILLIMSMPPSAKVRIIAKRKKKGVLVQYFSDDGAEHTALMEANLGQGILTHKDTGYIFQPRPARATDNDNKKIDVTEDEKDLIDEAMKHMCISDTGKPLLLGYTGKSLAVTPKLLKLIKQVNKRVTKSTINAFELIDPRLLKSYMSRTINLSLIESIKQEHERIGFNRRPVSDALKKAALPIGGLIMLIIVVYYLMSGGVDLSFINLGGPPA